MSLTGWPMLFTAALLVLAAPVLTHTLWTRVRGPRPVRLVTRLSMIGVCQVTAILLGFIIVNNHYNFYSSWDDLLGDDAGPGVITHQSAVDGPHRGGRGPGTRVRPEGPAQDFEPAGGGALAATFRGPLTGLSSHDDVYVWLPPQYSDPAYAKSSFPVVMLFPGFPGTPQTWFGAMAGQEALLKQLRADPGVTTPFVLAAVNINMEKGVNTNCTDIPGGPQVASFITQDVRPMLERSFRVMTDRRGWGLMGYSEGGLCAGKLLVQYPQDFSAAVQMSGDVRPDGVVRPLRRARAGRELDAVAVPAPQARAPGGAPGRRLAGGRHHARAGPGAPAGRPGQRLPAAQPVRRAQRQRVARLAAAGLRLAEPAARAGGAAGLVLSRGFAAQDRGPRRPDHGSRTAGFPRPPRRRRAG